MRRGRMGPPWERGLATLPYQRFPEGPRSDDPRYTKIVDSTSHHGANGNGAVARPHGESNCKQHR